MTQKQQRFIDRNNHVRKLFQTVQAKNPKWRIECVIEEVAKECFLACRTVEAIIGHEGIYGDRAKKNVNQLQMTF